MVSDVVLGALIGVGGSVIGYGISAWSNLRGTEKQIEAQTKRRRGEFYLEKKVETLTETFRAMEEAYNAYTNYHTSEEPPINIEDYEEDIEPKYRRYNAAMHRLNLFLDEKDAEKLVNLREDFHRMNAYLSPKSPSKVDPRHDMRESYSEATKVLETAVSEPLSSFESED